MLGTKAKTMRAAQPGALWRIASARMPTTWGMFDVIGFERDISNGTARVETALAIVLGRSDRRRSVAAHPFAVRYRRIARVAAL